MSSLYYSPVFYGIHDVTIPGASGAFAARVIYPSFDGAVWEAAIRPGTYPLVVFAPGDRASERALCPQDITQDHQKWDAVLHLLARCGFVVAIPAVHDIVGDSLGAAVRIEETVQWMRNGWVFRAALRLPAEFDPIRLRATERLARHGETKATYADRVRIIRPDVFLGPPTPLGLAGHSWGARACARVAVRGVVKVRAIAAVAGTWDENESIAALTSANIPNFLMCGSADLTRLSSLPGLWRSLAQPKHQAAVQGLDHWDWFGGQGGIHPCDPNAPRPACPVGWQIASELLLGFMTKYLWDAWWRPPYLLGSPGGRPPLLQWFDEDGCALKVRWEDPTATTDLPGEVTLGAWTDADPW